MQSFVGCQIRFDVDIHVNCVLSPASCRYLRDTKKRTYVIVYLCVFVSVSERDIICILRPGEVKCCFIERI